MERRDIYSILSSARSMDMHFHPHPRPWLGSSLHRAAPLALPLDRFFFLSNHHDCPRRIHSAIWTESGDTGQCSAVADRKKRDGKGGGAQLVCAELGPSQSRTPERSGGRTNPSVVPLFCLSALYYFARATPRQPSGQETRKTRRSTSLSYRYGAHWHWHCVGEGPAGRQ